MDEHSRHVPDVPPLELASNFGELIARAQRVLSVHGRLHGLVSASREVTGDLDLEHVLTRIVDAALALVDADSGELGVIGETGALDRVITLGVPGDHAATASVLGVPIWVRGQMFGILSLTKRPHETFTEEDEELIESLVATASIAIENARLYAEARRQERLSTVISEITAVLLAPGHDDVLGVVADGVAQLIPVARVVVIMPDEPDRLRVETAWGRGSAELSGIVFPAAGSIAAHAIATGTSVTDRDTERSPLDVCTRFGPTLAVPLITSGGEIIGALCASRDLGEAAFTPIELATMSDFAAQAGVAVSLAWERRDRQRLDLIHDRGRIARDLHDHVIQRLFGLGFNLMELATAVPASADRVDGYVAELDAAIADIRTAIFTLRGSPNHGRGLARHRLLDVVADLTPRLASTPRITFTGPVDIILTGELAEDVLAVVRESLANIARHAHAEHATIAVTVTEAAITVIVEDDGVGIDAAPDHLRGIANLSHRAQDRGGTFTIDARPDRGTRAQWQVPLPM